MEWTGDTLEKAKLVRISPEIPVDLHIKLKAIAFASKKSIGDISLEAINEYTSKIRTQKALFWRPKRILMGEIRQISIRYLPHDTYTTLRIFAIRENTSMKVLIFEALRDYVDPIWDVLKNQIKKGMEDAALLHKTGT